MNNTEFVITPNNVLIHGNKIHYYKGKCQLVRKIYICKNDKSISQINSKCITRLLRGKEAECETKDVGLVATIFEPEAGYIAIFNGGNVKLQTDCGVQNKAMVNNVQYEAVEMLGRAELKLNIPRIETIKRNRTTQELGIHELRMEDLETKIQISRIQ